MSDFVGAAGTPGSEEVCVLCVPCCTCDTVIHLPALLPPAGVHR